MSIGKQSKLHFLILRVPGFSKWCDLVATVLSMVLFKVVAVTGSSLCHLLFLSCHMVWTAICSAYRRSSNTFLSTVGFVMSSDSWSQSHCEVIFSLAFSIFPFNNSLEKEVVSSFDPCNVEST